MRLRANLHEADWAEEHIGGISYLRFLRELADGFETSWPTLRTAMERIRSLLVNRGSTALQRHDRCCELAPLRAGACFLP